MNRRPRQPAHALALLLAALLPLVALLCAAPRPAAAQADDLTIGYSGQGRPITAVRFGAGPRKLVVVGDTHGGPEANTYALSLQLVAHLRESPDTVPRSVSLYIIPTLNPDGLALGSRFNARMVDLNRNMDTGMDACPENDWRVEVQGAYGLVSETGGPYADSEVESRVIRAFLLDASGAIFLHSNAGLVFPAFCEHPPSNRMAHVYAAGAGYLYSRLWQRYTITGGMHDWAGSLGIAAITPELITGDQSEFEQNLAGLEAVLAQADDLLPPPEDRIEGGLVVPALIWRFWRAYGGGERFGPPLAPATTRDGLTRQVFERAVLELRAGDGAPAVQPAPLGRQSTAGRSFAPAEPDGASRFFPDTGHTLREVFLDYWERADGERLFGPPLSEELQARAADGQLRTVQYFERAVLAYYPEDGSVRPEPLGWSALLAERLRSPALPHQAR